MHPECQPFDPKILLRASYETGHGYFGSPRVPDDFIERGGHVSRETDHSIEISSVNFEQTAGRGFANVRRMSPPF